MDITYIAKLLSKDGPSVLEKAFALGEVRRDFEQRQGVAILPGRPSVRRGGKSFSQVLQENAGIPNSAVRLLHKIWKGLDRDLCKALIGSKVADNQTLLLRLAKLPANEQRAVAQIIKNGTGPEVAVAAAFVQPDPEHTEYVSFLENWSRLTEANKKRFLGMIIDTALENTR